MRWERHKLTGNVGISTDSASLNISRIIHTLNFIVKFLNLGCEFEDSVSIFDEFSSRKSIECRALKSLPFYHLTVIIHEEVVDLVEVVHHIQEYD